ncbi:universal stress protein UspA [Rickettsia endosymbiont of Cardiosporidium cionae]|nr:universal stress protein UspA [Rickettsia endosymbiont of Cardiosporidium cionae]
MFKNIVVPIDLLDNCSRSQSVMSSALKMVSDFHSKIHIINVIPNFGIQMLEDYLPRNWIREQKNVSLKKLKNIVNNSIYDNSVEVEYYVSRGVIYDEVIRYSEQVNADLIMVLAIRPQLGNYMLGSNASKIVRHSSISVLVIRE